MAKIDQGQRKRHVYTMVDSPVGKLTLVATHDGLAAILGRTTVRRCRTSAKRMI
jgi:hypothetical protein